MKEFTDEFINDLISCIENGDKEKVKELLDDLRGEQPEEPLADEGPVIEVLRTLQTEGVLHTGTDGRLRISGQQS